MTALQRSRSLNRWKLVDWMEEYIYFTCLLIKQSDDVLGKCLVRSANLGITQLDFVRRFWNNLKYLKYITKHILMSLSLILLYKGALVVLTSIQSPIGLDMNVSGLWDETYLEKNAHTDTGRAKKGPWSDTMSPI